MYMGDSRVKAIAGKEEEESWFFLLFVPDTRGSW